MIVGILQYLTEFWPPPISRRFVGFEHRGGGHQNIAGCAARDARTLSRGLDRLEHRHIATSCRRGRAHRKFAYQARFPSAEVHGGPLQIAGATTVRSAGVASMADERARWFIQRVLMVPRSLLSFPSRNGQPASPAATQFDPERW
jgi:hypothetical protein